MTEIQNKRAKEFLLKAEDFMKKNQYQNTIGYATAGLEVILIKAKEGDVRNIQNPPGLYEIIICSYLGINIEEYVRYRKMAGYWTPTPTGEAVWNKSGGLFSHATSEVNFDERDAEVSLEYCNKTIRNIEETLERLKKPLSKE